MENISETSHALTLENREHLTLSGIELNLETGYVSVSGKVTSLTYSEKFSSSSLLKRLFGG